MTEGPKPSELVKLEAGTTRVDEVKGYRPGGVFVIVDVRGTERMVRRIESPKADVCWADYWAV